MNSNELIRKLQQSLNSVGENLTVDGVFGPITQRALSNYKLSFVLNKIEKTEPDTKTYTHIHPIDWARGEMGQKEILGKADNPRIREYHTHSANIGSKEHPDEVPWCSSFLNAAADYCGMVGTYNALAASWDKFGEDSGDVVEEGDIVTIRHPNGGRHVTLANKTFNRKTDKTFEGLGGNQGNMVKVSIYSCAHIVGCRKWKPKPGTVTRPIMTSSTKAGSQVQNESTR